MALAAESTDFNPLSTFGPAPTPCIVAHRPVQPPPNNSIQDSQSSESDSDEATLPVKKLPPPPLPFRDLSAAAAAEPPPAESDLAGHFPDAPLTHSLFKELHATYALEFSMRAQLAGEPADVCERWAARGRLLNSFILQIDRRQGSSSGGAGDEAQQPAESEQRSSRDSRIRGVVVRARLKKREQEAQKKDSAKRRGDCWNTVVLARTQLALILQVLTDVFAVLGQAEGSVDLAAALAHLHAQSRPDTADQVASVGRDMAEKTRMLVSVAKKLSDEVKRMRKQLETLDWAASQRHSHSHSLLQRTELQILADADRLKKTLQIAIDWMSELRDAIQQLARLGVGVSVSRRATDPDATDLLSSPRALDTASSLSSSSSSLSLSLSSGSSSSSTPLSLMPPLQPSRSPSPRPSLQPAGDDASVTLANEARPFADTTGKCDGDSNAAAASLRQQVVSVVGDPRASFMSTHLKSGWMRKRGAVVKNWKRRFFVLHFSGLLVYSKDEHGDQIQGTVDLKAEALDIGRSPDVRKFGFFIRTETRTFYFKCTSQHNMNDWMDVIQLVVPKPPPTPSTS